jgi:hypothetical protein
MEIARGLKRRGIDPSQFPPGSWWVQELEVMRSSYVLHDADSKSTCVLLRKWPPHGVALSGSHRPNSNPKV